MVPVKNDKCGLSSVPMRCEVVEREYTSTACLCNNGVSSMGKSCLGENIVAIAFDSLLILLACLFIYVYSLASPAQLFFFFFFFFFWGGGGGGGGREGRKVVWWL